MNSKHDDGMSYQKKENSVEVTQNEYFCESDGHKYYYCPDCCELVEAYDNYCRHCGQKLKWSVKNVYKV